MSDLSPHHPGAEPLFTYREHQNGFELDADSTALVLVDLQYGSAADGYGFNRVYRELGYGDTVDRYLERVQRTVIPNVQLLQRAFRDAGAPVIFLTVGTITGDFSDMTPRFRRAVAFWEARGMEPPYARFGTREMDVLDEIAPVAGEPVIPKTGASGFTASPLERVLFNVGARSLVFGGVATNYCVQSTLRDAADRGFDCVLAEDACADATPAIHQVGIDSVSPFCRVASAAAIVDDITRPTSGSPTTAEDET
ncbi:isochorismatase family cysteine hydrolase [Microbacterium sp.]|uniref:cysteine hydrolase family protein n=1 Tax=Microbacterium sp. TaxID=51671 RepID=UPI0031FE624C|nr:cysteine hydrolase [Microbacterium sp.]